MSLDSHLLADRAVPRYTSYPTAPQFTASVGPANYAAWLSQLPLDASVSLYLHVPFCHDLCLYCGCHTKAVRRRDPLDSYAADLKAEIALIEGHTGRRGVSHIHWGGGTPSLLGTDRLLDLTQQIHDTFETGSAREHAIELDPRYVTPSLVKALVRMGISRASLGVQDFSSHVQRAIRRMQPYEKVWSAVNLLREGGIASLNFDLMYGLPEQTTQDVRSSAELAAGLKPERIALFGYAHVPWMKSQQRLIDAARLSGAAERFEQMKAGRDVFLSFEYEPIGLDHFALASDDLAKASRAGLLHRNFQGYTTDDASVLIGLGASAIGRLPQGFVQNATGVGAYSRSVRSGQLATARGVALTPEDRSRGRVIEGIMCNLAVEIGPGLDVSDCRNDHPFTAEVAALRPFADDGLVEFSRDQIRVTEKGRPFVRLIAAVFDSHLGASRSFHAKAV